jgi:hypothetical protein
MSFPTYDQCPPFCDGHADTSNLELHGTELDYFMPNGPVAVNQYGHDAAPLVALVDMASPNALYTPAQARQLACALNQAADLADRYTHSAPSVAAAHAILEREPEQYAAPAPDWTRGPFRTVMA